MKEVRFPWGLLFVHRSVSLVHHRARLPSYPGARGDIYTYMCVCVVCSSGFCETLFCLLSSWNDHKP